MDAIQSRCGRFVEENNLLPLQRIETRTTRSHCHVYNKNVMLIIQKKVIFQTWNYYCIKFPLFKLFYTCLFIYLLIFIYSKNLIKYLGVIFDLKLTYSTHISTSLRKAKGRLRQKCPILIKSSPSTLKPTLTIRSIMCNIQQFHFCICVFCMYLTTNSDFCPIHYLIRFYNRDGECFLLGKSWVFK